MSERAPRVLTPDQRLRVFISSTLLELAPERLAARSAIERLRLTPVFFEHGARPHPPEALYRAYLEQSQIFVGIYWQSYGWITPDGEVSGLEDEFRLSAGMPRLLYLKEPAREREPRLEAMVASFASDPSCTYKQFSSPDELGALLEADLALLLSERFLTDGKPSDARTTTIPAPPTSFVGRVSELERIEELIERQGARLVTLTGSGGIGKTRLAIEAARRLAHHFRDGVVFVPLDAVGDPTLVLPTLAAKLGLRETARDPVEVGPVQPCSPRRRRLHSAARSRRSAASSRHARNRRVAFYRADPGARLPPCTRRLRTSTTRTAPGAEGALAACAGRPERPPTGGTRSRNSALHVLDIDATAREALALVLAEGVGEEAAAACRDEEEELLARGPELADELVLTLEEVRRSRQSRPYRPVVAAICAGSFARPCPHLVAPAGARSAAARTISTGRFDPPSTPRETLPSSVFAIVPWPREPTTSRSMSWESA